MKAFGYALLFVGVLLVTITFAQTSAPPQAVGESGHKSGGKVTAAEHLARMTRMLNLTQDQQAKIMPILQNQFEEVDRIRQDKLIGMSEKTRRVLDIQERADRRIGELLTNEQKAKHEQTRQYKGRRAPGH